jgi:hypothetical protein
MVRGELIHSERRVSGLAENEIRMDRQPALETGAREIRHKRKGDGAILGVPRNSDLGTEDISDSLSGANLKETIEVHPTKPVRRSGCHAAIADFC